MYTTSLLPTGSPIKPSKIQHRPTSKTPENPRNFCTSLISPNPSIFIRSSSTFRLAVPKCSSGDGETPRMKDLLWGMVDKQVEELLNREENRDLLDGLDKATERVEKARRELLEIGRQEKEAEKLKKYVGELQKRESEVAECQEELQKARALVEEAELSLSSNIEQISYEGASENNQIEETDKEVERLESIKAALVSAIVGTLAGIPISFLGANDGAQLLFQLALIFISCALFGVTFRYTIRRDIDNIQLKTGTSAAFAFVKGLAELEVGPPLEFNTESFLSHAVSGSLYLSQSIVIFISAAVGLDYCFKMGFLSPFPIRKSVSKSKVKG